MSFALENEVRELKESDTRLHKLINYIKEETKKLEFSVEELEENFGIDFCELDPSDGGNFDDTYTMGRYHGEVLGQLELLKTLSRSFDV